MRNANTVIECTRFSLPTVDELIVKLRNAARFSKLELNKAFHQLQLDSKWRYITAFQTRDCIKRYKRLLLDINSPPEELQHALQTLLADIKNAINIEDVTVFVLFIFLGEDVAF